MTEAGVADRALVPTSSASPEVALAATGAASLSQRPGADRGPFNTRIGTVLLDTYRIEALLGAGGCGRVYRATHVRLQGTVAVKFLLPVWTQHEVLRARFDREARLLARLSHPGIVAAHDYGEDQGELYLVMEYVTGRQLGIIMVEEQQGMPVPRILSILEQALDVLAAAHSCGITHRDIKPSDVAREAGAAAIVPARRGRDQRGGSAPGAGPEAGTRTRSLVPAA